MQILSVAMTMVVALSLSMCTTSKPKTETTSAPTTTQVEVTPPASPTQTFPDSLDMAYFASGCFWCVEAVYESVRGVRESISGYAGGHTDNPTYQSTGTGRTGHAETVAIVYDADEISYQELVEVYYGSQDPTTIGQRPDFGSQYRSIIFYQNDEEKAIAEAAKMKQAKLYDDPIVTEIVPFKKFYEAEAYHQNFERRNPTQSYVLAVSIPRLERFKARFPHLLKAGSH